MMTTERANISTLTRESSIALFKEIGQIIRSGQVNMGRQHYALSLAHGVQQAIHCGYDKIVAIELGVAAGNGLLELCQSAHFFREYFGIDIKVYGLDGASGLPEVADYRDHPELWTAGDYNMGDPSILRKKLPHFAELIIGDVGETVVEVLDKIGDAKIGFVSVDLDYYSSTKRAMRLFSDPNPEKYLPALPVYFDDMDSLITLNEWCGEAAVINEFNTEHQYRKIDRKPYFNIPHFHVCHVLDHPLRQGLAKPRIPLSLYDF
ncbi:MAG: hypothetical protein P4M14_02105 [Gammaproteobacteria bacterium]|nr:hypothetical protein [Gammaproteobacteria bacterium]